MAEHETLRSGAASSLFHRMGHAGAQFEWCGELDDARHWTLTRVRGDGAANPIAVGHFGNVAAALLALSQAKVRVADVSPPKIVFGGAPRYLEASRGKYVLGHASAGDATVLLGVLGREVALIYLAPAASPQVLHVCPPLALTCFDVDRVVKLRSCADAATSCAAGPAGSSAEAAPETRSTGPSARKGPPPSGATTQGDAAHGGDSAARATGPSARKDPPPSDATTRRGAAHGGEPGFAVPVSIPAKVRAEHRRTVYGLIGNAVGPSLDDAIVNAFWAVVDRARLYVPPEGKKALGIQDVERVVEFFLQLAAQGCRDFGGLSGTIHREISERLPEFDVPRYAFARVLELLHAVGTCILEKPSERRSQLRFVGLNDPTSELHRRFVAETETLCVIKLPPGSVPPEPRPKRERVQREGKGKGKGYAKPRAGADAGPPAQGPRADGDESAGAAPVLGDMRGPTAGIEDGEPGARCGKIELPTLDAELGNDEPRGVERRRSEFLAALDGLVRGLFGPDEESRSGSGLAESAAAAHVGAETGPSREQEDEAPLDVDDVVRMLLGLGRPPVRVPVDEDEADEPALGELRELDDEPALDERHEVDGEPALDELRELDDEPRAGERGLDELSELDGEPTAGELREPDGEPTAGELREPDDEPALSELRELDGEPTLDELRKLDDEPALGELRELDGEPSAGERGLDELRELDGEPTAGEVREPDDEPALSELRELDGEPTAGEVREPDDEPALSELHELDDEPAAGELREPDGDPALGELRELADEPALGELRELERAEAQNEEPSGGANRDEPPVEFAGQGAASGSSESPLAGPGRELPPPAVPHDDGVGALREFGETGSIRELGERLASCDRMARERLSIVLEEVCGGDRSDLSRDPTPPVLDFRVAVMGRASSSRVCCTPIWLASCSVCSPGRLRVVSPARRRGARGLGLLGPRGPPRPRAPGAAPWGDCEARLRSEAETDRGRAAGRRGASGREHLSGDVAVLFRRIVPTRSSTSRHGERTAAPPRLWCRRVDPHSLRRGETWTERSAQRAELRSHGQREPHETEPSTRFVAHRRGQLRTRARPATGLGLSPEISLRIFVAGENSRSARAPVRSSTRCYPGDAERLGDVTRWFRSDPFRSQGLGESENRREVSSVANIRDAAERLPFEPDSRRLSSSFTTLPLDSDSPARPQRTRAA